MKVFLILTMIVLTFHIIFSNELKEKEFKMYRDDVEILHK